MTAHIDPDVCTDCAGSGTIEHPAWTAWWKAHDEARAAWEHTHPGQLWLDSIRYAELDAQCPDNDVPEERRCPTCEGDGDVDHVIDLAAMIYDELGADPRPIETLVTYIRGQRLEDLRDKFTTIATQAARAAHIVTEQLELTTAGQQRPPSSHHDHGATGAQR
ncbi:hypothetical protein ACWDTP_12115 [Mycobacterium sp. NPDC003449]